MPPLRLNKPPNIQIHVASPAMEKEINEKTQRQCGENLNSRLLLSARAEPPGLGGLQREQLLFPLFGGPITSNNSP